MQTQRRAGYRVWRPSASATTQIDDGIICPDPVSAGEQETSLLAEEVPNDDEMPNETASPETIPKAPIKDRSSIDQKPTEVLKVPKLIRLMSSSSVQDITQVLDMGHEPDCRHPDNKGTGLIFAAMQSNHIVLRLLLDRGASISAEDKQKRTALHYAASGDCK